MIGYIERNVIDMNMCQGAEQGSAEFRDDVSYYVMFVM